MTADTPPPPSTTPAATVRLSDGEWAILHDWYDDEGDETLEGLEIAVERILADRAQIALADPDRAERRLAAVEALVGKWEASAGEAESIAQARIGIADVMDYLVAAVVRRQCARDLNTALTADQPTAGGDEAGL